MLDYYRKHKTSIDSIVKDGKFQFGLYKSAFKELNFLDAHKVWNKLTPKFFKKFRLKEWQAFQFFVRDYIVFGAIYNAKLIGVSVLSVYNFKSREKHHRVKLTFPWKQKVAKSLFNSVSRYNSNTCKLKIKNDIELKRFEIDCSNAESDIYLKVTAFHNTEPMINCMPLGKNRAMYSHKALMPCSGEFKIGKTVYKVNRNDSVLILDDHKGFYPYKLKYNWVTAAWQTSDGVFYGFNLTQNQSVDAENYNENCFWVNGMLHVLPPVTFKVAEEKWQIKDKLGLVDLEFTVTDTNNLKVNLGVIASDYRAPYGVFNGILKNHKHIIRLNNIGGMGEIKRYQM